MSLIQWQVLKEFGFLGALEALLGSEGIVVKCTSRHPFSYGGLAPTQPGRVWQQQQQQKTKSGAGWWGELTF